MALDQHKQNEKPIAIPKCHNVITNNQITGNKYNSCNMFSLNWDEVAVVLMPQLNGFHYKSLSHKEIKEIQTLGSLTYFGVLKLRKIIALTLFERNLRGATVR
jgi:hypothetical protein